ncbi:MAG: arsenate reductase (glutaredoxin) [Bacteroidetes bacterium RIFCSPHIGHO2_02_FULL_44_7]|nr:MAG: arsenate reductase (glutaredoxin) [Bacteroidetes bacterium RIFCSPHIGHO2_02_FULL_44_7]
MVDKENVTIYHNARCSKSRQALSFLDELQGTYEIVEYLKSPPTLEELKEIIRKLGIRPEQLVRKSEAEFKANYAGKVLSDKQWLAALMRFPQLIERPIVVRGERAVIARPTERIMELD